MTQQTSWMWQDEWSQGVQGAQIDAERGLIYWFDQPGCACDDADEVQTLADFLAKGALRIVPPEDVLAEVRAVAQALHMQA